MNLDIQLNFQSKCEITCFLLGTNSKMWEEKDKLREDAKIRDLLSEKCALERKPRMWLSVFAGASDKSRHNSNPLQYSCLENPMDRGACEVAKSWTQLNNFTFTFHFHALQKEMVTHSSVLAWRIPGTGEPGGLLSMGSHRVGHDWSDLA